MAITTTRDGVPVGGTTGKAPGVLTAPPLKVPHISWRALAPIALTLALALVPPPAGLALHAWYFFAIFAGVILALMLEPLPGGAVGLIGVTVVAVLAQYVLFSPADLAKPGFKPADAALAWALSGFANSTVWLIFGAFMFALGYEKTGLGRRMALVLVKKMGRRTLTLGYAIAVADTILAPFTPSNTARSGGTIYPVIRNLPGLYDSKPDDPSSRRIGSYLMWVAIATTCVTSSMFLTALAPNLLAVELVNKTSQVQLTWTQWFVAFAPIGIAMLVLIPVSWDDIVKNSSAWNTLAWFATLVALADGLNRVGFVKWFADAVASHMAGFSPFTAMIVLVLVFFVTHYLFASVTAHVTALLPVMLAVGATIPGLPMPEFALLLCLTLGIMGILTPYATGPSPVYYGSGYLPARDYWRLGAIFGVIFIALFLVVTLPWLALIG